MRRSAVRAAPPGSAAETHEAPRAPERASAVLALQRSAGNRAVAGMLQRAPFGYVVGTLGRHFDGQLGAYVNIEHELDGLDPLKPWLVLHEEALDQRWLYQPAFGGLEAQYTLFSGLVDYRAKWVAATVAQQEAVVGENLEAGPWAPKLDVGERAQRSVKDRARLQHDLADGIKAWTEYEARVAKRATLLQDTSAATQLDRVMGIRARVEATFKRLIASLGGGTQSIEFTGELAGQVHRIADAALSALKAPLPKRDDTPPQVLTEKAETEASQLLSELDWAVLILAREKLAEPLVQGAKGRMLPPGMAGVPEPESEHGGLPPLNVVNLEADSYYLTADRVLHLDEVKDSPNALGQKAKDGEQIGRHAEWLAKDVMDPETGEWRVKRVGYFCRTGGPKFDVLLSDEAISNLELLALMQRDIPFLNIAGEALRITDLRAIYDAAIAWLLHSRPALLQDAAMLKAGKVDNSLVFKKYFDSLGLTRATLAKGPLK